MIGKNHESIPYSMYGIKSRQKMSRRPDSKLFYLLKPNQMSKCCAAFESSALRCCAAFVNAAAASQSAAQHFKVLRSILRCCYKCCTAFTVLQQYFQCCGSIFSAAAAFSMLQQHFQCIFHAFVNAAAASQSAAQHFKMLL